MKREPFLPALDRPSPGCRGFSLTEIMIALAAFVIMMVMFSPMFSLSQKSFTALEMTSTLKDGGQKALNRISADLGKSRRLFKAGVLDDANYLNNVKAHISQPGPVNWTFLPDNNVNSAVSPPDSNFDPNKVGNSLFLASTEYTYDITVMNAGVVPGAETTLRIDAYRFNLYYLATESGEVGGKPRINLYEWHSVPFADFSQLSSITQVSVATAAVAYLLEKGVSHAWDPAATYATGFYPFSSVKYPMFADAFYPTMTGNWAGWAPLGAVAAPPGSLPPQISRGSGGPAVELLMGGGGGSYRYGVSPNTDAGLAIKDKVPTLAIAPATPKAAPNQEFPSGFEVVMAGPKDQRIIFLRLVLVGYSGKTVYSKEHLLLLPTNDIN